MKHTKQNMSTLITHKKYIDESWDFRKADTKTLTHCFHIYPAMMIPQISARLIDTYGKTAKSLFDPYCGTGTSLVEASIRNMNAIGTDLNPLARLISKCKTTVVDLALLDECITEFNDYSFSLTFDKQQDTPKIIPTFKNIDYWFEASVKEKLGIINAFIQKISDIDSQNFFKVAFSETVRESSWTRNSEFKLYRMSEQQREKFNPNVFGKMQSKLIRNRKGLENYINLIETHNNNIQVDSFNTVAPITKIEKESIDIVVTSPPYGDSRTTVAYGQFSRLANQWLGVEEASQVDKQLMGGQKQNDLIFQHPLLQEIIGKVADKDEKRAKEVASFYADYQKSINNVSQTIKYGGYTCYVVGNRTVKGIKLPTDEITQLFFEANGFKHQETIIRNIPNKRMPKKNSPSNITGKTSTTMNQEYIVVMRKE